MFNTKYVKFKEKVTTELVDVQKIICNSILIEEFLKEPVLKFLNAPSKKIRIVLPIFYLKALGEEITEKHLKLFSALEIVHNASLIHDDIIDDGKVRRGETAIYKKFGNKLGVIAGDYLLSVAMGILSEINSTEIFKIFSKALKQMCIGEINQNYNLYKIGSIEEYIEKSKNKTAYLFETAMFCSVLLCNKQYNINEVRNFGLNFGIAFQIRDDLLNIMNKDFSKQSNDVEEGIYNAPVIYSDGVENLSQGIEKTHILLNNYVDSAIEALNILPKNDYKSALIKITELLKDD